MLIGNCVNYDVIKDFYSWVSNHSSLNQPLTLYVSPTYRCNLRCSYCFNNCRDSEIFNLNDFKYHFEKLSEWYPLRIVITGGEPLLFNKLVELLTFIKASGNSITLATNGTLVQDKVEPILNLVDWFDVSIPTCIPYVHNRTSAVTGIEFVNDSLNLLIKNGARTRVSVLLVPEAFESLLDTVETLLKLGISRLKLQSVLLPPGCNIILSSQQNNILQHINTLYQNEERLWIPSTIQMTKQQLKGYLYFWSNGNLGTFNNEGHFDKLAKVDELAKGASISNSLRQIIEEQIAMFKVI